MNNKNELKKLNKNEISTVAGGKIICLDESFKGFCEEVDRIIDNVPESAKYILINDDLFSFKFIAAFGSMSDAKDFAEAKGLSDKDITDPVREFFKVLFDKN